MRHRSIGQYGIAKRCAMSPLKLIDRAIAKSLSSLGACGREIEPLLASNFQSRFTFLHM
jgi:hypothetical protein